MRAVDPSIYIPADEQGDPFKRHRRRSAKKMALLGGGALAGVAALGAIGFFAFSAEPLPAEPSSLVAGLEETSWAPASDPATGYRPLLWPWGEGLMLNAIAVGPDGTLVMARRVRGGPMHLVVWKAGRFEEVPVPLERGEEISAIAVLPRGGALLGTGQGRLGLFPRAAAPVEMWEAVAPGYGIARIAVAPAGDRVAVMVASGATFVGPLPLREGALEELAMPPRARVRQVIFDADGDLFVAGDAGAVFERAGDEWRERPLPGRGDVTAVGRDAYGELLVGQSSGSLVVAEGTTWSEIDQAPARPLAVGAMPELGLVLLATDGRLFATYDRDELSELSTHERPDGVEAFALGQIAGDNVVLASRDRIAVSDGSRTWDPRRRLPPEGLLDVPACEIAGPVSGAVDGLAGWIRCGGRRARVEGGALRTLDDVDVSGAEVAPAELELALEGSRTDRWMGRDLVRCAPVAEAPGIERWSAARRTWERLLDTPAEEEALLSVAASAGDAGTGHELWSVSRTGAVRLTTVTSAGSSAPALVVASPAFEAHVGPSPSLPSAELFALGSGRALLLLEGHDGCAVLRLHRDGTVERLPALERAGACETVAVQVGERVIVSGGGLFDVPADGPPIEQALPEGIDVLGLTGAAYRVAVDGPRTVVITLDVHGAGGFQLVTCEATRCRRLPLPPGVSPQGLLFTTDHRLVVVESTGMVGILEPR